MTAAPIGLAVLAVALVAATVARPQVSLTNIRPTPTVLWAGLLSETPVAVGEPLPPPEPQPVDGTYVVHRDTPPQWWACLRCADYRPSGGTWRLLLDRGVLRLVYDVTGWRTIASYRLDGEIFEVFNDPICPSERGVYRWRAQEDGLSFAVVRDDCAFGLRAENLTSDPWRSCAPPDARAAASEAWPTARGCLPGRVPPAPGAPGDVEVIIVPGDIRKAPDRPAALLAANAFGAAPAPLSLRRAPGVVPYGLNLILWEGGAWVEATAAQSVEAIGVQFWGPSTMGAARLLLDGQEVWRGEVALLGRHLQQYGGYVEVRGLGPGSHTLRVEPLGPDGRPLTILWFGVR